MTKAELIADISKRADSTKADAERFLNATLEAVQKALSGGDGIPLIGFGTFSVVKRAARQGRNPRDPNKKINIPASKTVKFKVGSKLKAAVNKR